jgi:acetone carboxylase gamma subunit
MINKCDCGHVFAEKDIGTVDQAGPDYYPYEGEIITFVCPDCGCITDVKESEVTLCHN